MAEILKNGQVHNDHWQVLHLEADADPAAQAVTAGQWLVPFNVWIADSQTPISPARSLSASRCAIHTLKGTSH